MRFLTACLTFFVVMEMIGIFLYLMCSLGEFVLSGRGGGREMELAIALIKGGGFFPAGSRLLMLTGPFAAGFTLIVVAVTTDAPWARSLWAAIMFTMVAMILGLLIWGLFAGWLFRMDTMVHQMSAGTGLLSFLVGSAVATIVVHHYFRIVRRRP